MSKIRIVGLISLSATMSLACSESPPAEPFNVQQPLTESDRAAEVAEYLVQSYFSRFVVQATTKGPFGEVVVSCLS